MDINQFVGHLLNRLLGGERDVEGIVVLIGLLNRLLGGELNAIPNFKRAINDLRHLGAKKIV